MPVTPIDDDLTTTDAGTATGIAATLGPLNMAASNTFTYTKTMYIVAGGTAFSTAVAQGSFDGTNWVTIKDIYWTSVTVATTGTTHFVIGASYPYIKVVTTGGASDSTLTAKIID